APASMRSPPLSSVCRSSSSPLPASAWSVGCSAESPAESSARSSRTSRGPAACSCSYHPSYPPGGDPRNPVRTALVTGASGYIGGLLVPHLLEAGYDVRVLTRSGHLDAPWVGDVQVYRGD